MPVPSPSTPWICFYTQTDPAPEGWVRRSCSGKHKPSGLMLPANTHSEVDGKGKGRCCLVGSKKPVPGADTVSQKFLFLCGGVDISEKIICSDSILASFTLPVRADDYLLLQRESGVALHFSFLKSILCLQWGGLFSLQIIPLTLWKPTHLIAHSLCRFNKSVPAVGW